MPKTLQKELSKRNPFESIEQEAMLSIMRTSDLLENRLARLLRQFELTPTQYNVLRILRGEGKPLPCLEVANRMIQVAPAITRVVDQLLALKLISKTQSTEDRRVHTLELRPAGDKLLAKLDQPIIDLHIELFTGVSKAKQASLVQILQEIRSGLSDDNDSDN